MMLASSTLKNSSFASPVRGDGGKSMSPDTLRFFRTFRNGGRATQLSRRGFMGGGSALALLAALSPGRMFAAARSGKNPTAIRLMRVFQARLRAAELVRDATIHPSPSNGDEKRHEQRWGNYSKGLPHDTEGQVDPRAYDAYLRAIESEDSALFERIPLGGYLKLSNPQAAFAIDLTGPDCLQLPMAPPPALASAEQASELVELYWHAVLRDVPFADYDKDPLVSKASAELSRMSDFRGPKESGSVTPGTLFRGLSRGGRRGPYISQFFLRDIPLSPIRVPYKIRTAVAGRDFMTSFDEWLNIQNGQLAGVNTFENGPRYIRTGRDVGEYVHRDFTYQAGVCACMMLLKMSAPLDGGIPYQYSITQGGFVTFGPSDIFHLVATVANLALKPAWYQKWVVHRRARPEELGGRIHLHAVGRSKTPFHRDVLDAEVLTIVKQRNATYLLPQAYPEGAPSHPSYPAGHAVISGACITVLKAVFAENWVLPNCVVPSADGQSLEPYHGPELTVGGELDKLAENIAIARNFAGLHWRSDGIEGIRLGEEYAIRYLREMKLTSNEFFTGFSLTKFDGTTITV
jgi:hypothetical protein